MKNILSSIERLEPRIAPANVGLLIAANGHSATFGDVDGEIVKVSVSTGTLVKADFHLTSQGAAYHFDELDLSATGVGGFSGANVTISASKIKGGDGHVAVGYINAGTNNLGNVSIKGDLGRIDAGNNNNATPPIPAIKTLTVASIGRFAAEPPGTILTSTINGNVKTIKIKGDMDGTFLHVKGAIDTIFIAGSLYGGDNSNDGDILADSSINKLTIKHDIHGGKGTSSGAVSGIIGIQTTTVGGSIYGGAGSYSGSIGAGEVLSSVTVKGSVFGGKGDNSGDLYSSFLMDGAIGVASIGGSLVGGDGQYSGVLGGKPAAGGGHNVFMEIVTIGKDIIGGTGANSGYVDAIGSGIEGILLKGSLIGGSNTASFSGAITGSLGLNLVSILGSIDGGSGPASGVVFGGSINKISIAGSLNGGSGAESGAVDSVNIINLLHIHGDVHGGSGNNSGYVHSASITSKMLDGLLIAGTGTSSGTVTP